MKKQDYLKPCVKVRPIQYEGKLLDDGGLLPASSEDEVGEDGPWAKEHDFNYGEDEGGYKSFTVWED